MNKSDKLHIDEVLDAQQRSLLSLRLRSTAIKDKGSDVVPESETIIAGPRPDPLLASFAQRQFWLIDKLSESRQAYGFPTIFRIKGNFRPDHLRRAFETLISRHEPLRTRFVLRNEQLIQIIDQRLSGWFTLVHLTDIPVSLQENAAKTLLAECARLPFDLGAGPVLRAFVFVLNPDDHIVFFNLHHIACDALSLNILCEELTVLYKFYSEGTVPGLPPLRIQYADYAVWQRESADMQNGLTYWKQHLKDLSPLRLPTELSQVRSSESKGNEKSVTVSLQLTNALKKLSVEHGNTLFVTVLSVFYVLLQRLSAQDDIVVGCPISGRSHRDTKGVVGPFLNTLALRADLTGNPTFSGFLKRVRESVLMAFEHQDVPFEAVVDQIDGDRKETHAPILNVLFNFVNTPRPALQLLGSSLNRLAIPETHVKFPFTLYVEEKDKLYCTAAYQENLFSEGKIDCLLRQFVFLLEQIADHAARPINEYSLVPHEHKILLPDPTVELKAPHFDSVVELFVKRAAEQPDRVAVSKGGQVWTYSMMESQVRHAGLALLQRGLKPTHVVAVAGASSFELLTSMLAVLWCRCILLLIDTSLPISRQQAMMTEAGAVHLIKAGQEEPSDSVFALLLGTTYISGGKGWSSVVVHDDDKREALPLPLIDDPAYIMFTSGTDGVPKGILGVHKGLAHFIAWQRNTFSVVPEDRCAQLTRLTFDPVLREFFLPLTSGAQICLPANSSDANGTTVLHWLAEQQISLLHAVPTLAKAWLVLPYEKLSSLRCIFFAGEPLTGDFVSRWRKRFPEAGKIVNLYGPTETTLAKCFYEVPPNCHDGYLPVGKPISDSQALVLSTNNRLCGINERGQVVMRTPFMTLGYINPGTEEAGRFSTNPFTEKESDKVYFTGDIGMYLADGSLQLSGRHDRLIKVRGIRVEPGEVESVLRQHPQVADAVVVASKKENENFLIAYVQPVTGQIISHADLFRFAAQVLPGAMLPSKFVTLESFPATRNGKLDYAALPSPTRDQDQSAVPSLPARDKFELEMMLAWERILKVGPIKMSDNFFDLGGNSLSAILLLADIKYEYGEDIPVTWLLLNPTLESFAKMLREEYSANSQSFVVALQSRGTRPPLFCIHPAGGSVFCYLRLAKDLGADQPLIGFQSPGLYGERELLTTVEELAACYIEAMISKQSSGPYWIMGYSAGGMVALEMARQLAIKGEESHVILIDTMPPDPGPGYKYNEWLVLHNALGLPVTDESGPFRLDENQIHTLVADARKKNLIPPGLDESAIQRYFEMYRTNSEAARNYIPPPCSSRIVLFRAAHDIAEDKSDLTLGWEAIAMNGLDVFEIQADHSSIIESPELAAVLQELLRADGTSDMLSPQTMTTGSMTAPTQ